jgi:hypothetical protein
MAGVRRTTKARGARRWAAALAALAVPALVAGCSAGPGPDTETSSGGTPAGGVAPPSTSSSPAPTMIPEDALLAAFDLQQSDDDATAQVRAFQEAVARCMRDAGFEYTPDVPDRVSTDPGASPAPGHEEEWAAQWGFGISIDMSPLYTDAPTDRPDPNAGYVASLSPAGQQAYHDALEGTLHEGQTPTGAEGELGCYTTAGDELATASPVPTTPPLVTELEEEVWAQTYERMATDEELADAVATLADCAAQAGAIDYDPHADSGVQIGVGDKTYTPAYEPWSAYDQVASAWEDLTADGAPDAGQLAKFQQWERDMAVAEVRCNAPTRAVVDKIHAQAAHDVVGPHRAELEDLLATWPDG